MTSSGKLSSAIVDFVAPLRLWHGLRPPPMVGFVERESPAGRLPGQPCARLNAPSSGAPESCKREERASVTRASSFQLSGLDAAHRRLIESDCPYGAELHPCPWFSCKAFSMEKRITFDPCIKTFIKFTHL